MIIKGLRFASWPIVAVALVAPMAMHCGGGMPAVPGAGNLPGPAGDLANNATGGALSCPDFSSAEAAMKADLVGSFKLDAEGAGKVKAGVAAAVDIKGFSDKIDADLKVACGGLAKDLGVAGDFASGQDACKAAMKAIGDVKAKLGASAKVSIDIKPPVCKAEMNVVADCAAKCDVNVKPGSAKVECEPGKLSGSCSGECSGSCDMSAAAKCEGTCAGTCDAQASGSCSGKCTGKCDGKDAKGVSCAGTCDGKCDGNVHGECKGQCGGSCKLKAQAKCSGTCTGGCKGEFKEPKCAGEIKPPEMSADCKAKCNTEVTAKAECTPASVGLRVSGAADAKIAEQYKTAIEKNLPGVLKIAIGIGERGVKVAGQVQTVVEGLQGSVSSMVKADGASAAMIGGKLVQCTTAPFKAALDGAASIKANVNVSVEVKASASASGSASGKAG